MDYVLEAEDLVKTYKYSWKRQKIVALNHLNISIKQGEIYGLLGPNGSGKTTAIKSFLGLVKLNSGKIKIFNKDAHLLEIKSRIGYLPEESYFYKFLTAKESMNFYGSLAGISKKEIKRKMDQILSQVGLLQAKDLWVRNFSKGMLRRLGFAFILLKEPDLIFLDEPTVGLDPIGALQVREMMLDLKGKGKTIVMSSHLLGEIENVCDRVAILYQGKVLKEDTLDKILDVPDKIQVIIKKDDKSNPEIIRKALQELHIQVETLSHPKKTLEKAFLEILGKQQ